MVLAHPIGLSLRGSIQCGLSLYKAVCQARIRPGLLRHISRQDDYSLRILSGNLAVI